MGREGGGARGVEAHVDARSEIRLDVEGGGGGLYVCGGVFVFDFRDLGMFGWSGCKEIGEGGGCWTSRWWVGRVAVLLR